MSDVSKNKEYDHDGKVVSGLFVSIATSYVSFISAYSIVGSHKFLSFILFFARHERTIIANRYITTVSCYYVGEAIILGV